MTDYISREEVGKALTTAEPVNNGGIKYNRYPPSHDEVLKRISAIPAADVVEQKNGKWERAQEQPFFRKHFDIVVCSCCHNRGNKKWNFCPNCGARMDGE